MHGRIFLPSRVVDGNRRGKLHCHLFLPRRLIICNAECVSSRLILSSWVWGAYSVPSRLILCRSRFGAHDLSNRELLPGLVARADFVPSRGVWQHNGSIY